MPDLESALKRLCPAGVEYKTIGEIATDIYRGSGIKREEILEAGMPCVRYGEIYTTYGIWFDRCVSYTSLDYVTSPKYFEHGDILFAITGESVEDIAKSCAYVGHERCIAGGDIVVLKHEQNPKYLAYALSTTEAKRQKSKGKTKNKVVHSSVPSIKSIRIPIPPLDIQEELVKLLDEMSALSTSLSTELLSELQGRKKQCNYYRCKLLDRYADGNKVRSGELGKWHGGKTPSMKEKKFWENGTIPWISSKDMKKAILDDTKDHITDIALKEASMMLFPEESIAIVTRSGILKHTFPVAYIPFRTTINQDIKALVVRDGVSARYVSLVMQAYGEDIRIKTKKQGGTVDSLDFNKIMEYEIPLPEYDEQLKIVDEMGKLENSFSELDNCLKAEIEAIGKQYEYYRDKLLTFKEAV